MRLNRGDPTDDAIDALIQFGRVPRPPAAELARVVMGVAYKKGAGSPT